MPLVTHRVITVTLEFRDEGVVPLGEVIDQRLTSVLTAFNAKITALEVRGSLSSKLPIVDKSQYPRGA